MKFRSLFFQKEKMPIGSMRLSLISQFLVLLDGLETRGLVMVIGTTNRIEAVDSAKRRPAVDNLIMEI